MATVQPTAAVCLHETPQDACTHAKASVHSCQQMSTVMRRQAVGGVSNMGKKLAGTLRCNSEGLWSCAWFLKAALSLTSLDLLLFPLDPDKLLIHDGALCLYSSFESEPLFLR